jgi:hypothetical protein
MLDNKTLIGNSGDIVYLFDTYVVKEAGKYKDKFKQQMIWMENCQHPNFIKIKPISVHSYKMEKYQTWFDKICNQSLSKSIEQLEKLLEIISSFDGKISQINVNSYLSKLEARTGYKYSGNFFAETKWGFVHGDLTVSNILYDNDFILIDPRGTDEQDYYDYGKLMQSFHMKYESYIYNDWNSKYVKFCNSAEEIMRSRYDNNLLDFYLAVHLLGAVPFFIMNNRNELANIFLIKGHELFNKLGIKYSK